MSVTVTNQNIFCMFVYCFRLMLVDVYCEHAQWPTGALYTAKWQTKNVSGEYVREIQMPTGQEESDVQYTVTVRVKEQSACFSYFF